MIAFKGTGPVLSVPTLSLAAGSACGILGPSGAGKTSLLHALAGIERPAQGSVQWDDDALWALPDPARDRWRRERLGLVFQDMHLLDGLSALDNVLLPVLFDHARAPAALRDRAAALLDGLGITAERTVSVMSRGERQRVALARALLRRPAVLLADEPTASLDAAAAEQVAGLLLDAAAANGATLLIATHDPALLARLPTRLAVRAGQLEPVA